jgi:hypothetical protein
MLARRAPAGRDRVPLSSMPLVFLHDPRRAAPQTTPVAGGA